MKEYILIPDSLTRKGFDICSILFRLFPDSLFIVGSDSDGYIKRAYIRMLYGKAVEPLRKEEFVSDLYTISRKYQDGRIVFIPTEEKTVDLFYQYVEKYGKGNFEYLLPSYDLFCLSRDKKRLNESCLANHVGAPICYASGEIRHIDNSLYPILLKPVSGSGSRGIIRLSRKEDFTPEIERMILSEPYHVQELIENGKDVKGAFFLYVNGDYVEAYTHERIRTSPKEGGVTVLSRVSNNKEIIEEGKKLLDQLGWSGLIMLEFLYDPKVAKYKIIEANPRIWGSIMLAEFSGANLLSDYVRLCRGESPTGCNPNKQVYIRWLFPVDLLCFVKEKGRIGNFWKFANTCFINWTYANKFSAVVYNVISLFDPQKIARFFRR